MRSAVLLLLLACAFAPALAYAQSGAQSYPSKAIRIIVPYAPGGIADNLARLVGQIDNISGQVPLYFGAMSSPLPHVKAGKLRAIAVTTLKRASAAPEIPTLDEQGLKGFETSTWYGVAAPAGTPKEIVSKLNAEIVRIIRLPDVRDRLAAEGADVVGDTPEELTAFVKAEIAKWNKVVKQSGAKVG
jgi:tripartite-type tricarboxylate transporter receptor subunit TctC